MSAYHTASGSAAEDLFIDLFSEAFGAEKAGYLYSQYHFYDIYQNSRYADFVLENGAHRVAFEIDDETSHNKTLVASNKFYDDLLKQNSKLDDIVSYFRSYYEGRRAADLPVEKGNSIFAKGSCTDKDAERNILANPFKRFEDMQMMHHTKTLGIVQVDESVRKRLTAEKKTEIGRICDEKLADYFKRLI